MAQQGPDDEADPIAIMRTGRGWTEGAEVHALREAELAPYLHVAGSALAVGGLATTASQLSPGGTTTIAATSR